MIWAPLFLVILSEFSAGGCLAGLLYKPDAVISACFTLEVVLTIYWSFVTAREAERHV